MAINDDFDTSLRSERQLADIEEQANAPRLPTETDEGLFVRKDILTAKGDLYAATAANVVGRQALGTNGQVLTVDTTTSTGLKYADITGLSGVLGADHGGTGQSSYAVGDLLYASGATALSKLADVAAGSYLRSGGVTTAPLWSTTTLPNSAVVGDVLYASASNVYSNLADVATGNALISGGVTTAPSWGKIGLTTHVSGTLPIANGGTNDTGTAWTTYTPTITTGSGSFTTATASGRSKTLGKTVWVEMSLTITTNGTAGGLITLSLPFTAVAAQFSLAGAETATVGYALSVIIPSSGTTAQIRRYDADTAAYHANGVVLVVSGVYEQA